ncbi:unnamed protein product [Orchesella dallaii]|uniref:Ionotropic glutamate receptor C-terminal domain-containing protein n=1 Tax=Orchesella dallaii TaxID=48710 RepID=A0ABP1Q768_9HEXA
MALLLEQSGGLLRWRRRSAKIMVVTWIFTTILLRHFYNSSLYSFMAKEKDSNDFPKSMEELLIREDIPLLSPASFLSELNWIFGREAETKMALRLIKFYMKILYKSSFIFGIDGVYEKSLHQASNGCPINTTYFTVNHNKTADRRIANDFSSDRNFKEKRFTQFAFMCEGNYEKSLKGGFIAQTGTNNRVVVPKQKPFLRVFNFWYAFPNFSTHSFYKFVGYFVQSGLHDLATSRYKILKQLQLLESLNYGRKLGISNGSLFSYLFLSQKQGDMDDDDNHKREHASAKVSEFVGTFILTGFMVGLSFMILIFEVGKSLFKEKK